MTPARTVTLKEGSKANLYVWYEYSGYYAAYFLEDKIPLVVDSEFLKPGSFYGPFSTHSEAEASGIACLKQMVITTGLVVSSAA